jgi:hypothetical protein
MRHQRANVAADERNVQASDVAVLAPPHPKQKK